MKDEEKRSRSLESVTSKKHVIVEAKGKNIAKLESFCKVMQEVAEDMDLRAYVDDSHYVIGSDY